LFWLALILLLPQRGTFYEYYETGTKKFEQEDYRGAVIDLERAIELRKKSQPNAKTYSLLTISYHPYHYLAEACIRLKDYERARRYRDLAYRYGEDSFDDGAYEISLDLLGLALTAAEEPTKTSVTDASTPPVDNTMKEFTPMLNLILQEHYDEALVHVEKLLLAHPENESLLDTKKHLSDTAEASRQQALAQQARADELKTVLRKARTSEANEEFRIALFLYQDVRARDPENAEAARAIPLLLDALKDKWTQEGRGDEFLELEKEFNDAISAQNIRIAEVEAEKGKLVGELEASKTKLKDALTRTINPTQFRPWVEWGVRPLSIADYTANIQVAVKSNVDLTKVSIYLERGDKLLKEWVIAGQRDFISPIIPSYDFGTINANMYALIEGEGGVIEQMDYPFNFKPNVVPFYKKRYFKLALSISLSLLIAGAFFLNQMRRRRAFRLRFNPYVAGAPILTDEMYYGRDATMKQILNTLHNNSLMIFGERRIGKTSFLHRLNKELGHHEDPQYNFIPVFIDLQGVAEEDFFHVMDQEIALVLEDYEIRLDPPPDQLSGRGFISRLRAYIAELKKRVDKKPKLVLLLDEVDVMNGFSEHTNQKLRSVFMKGFADHIVSVMAGIHINTRWKSEGSPWYNFFEQIELKPFNRNLTDSLVQKPVQGIYQYTNQAVDRIMEITGGKPYLVQKMCLNLISHILVENKRKVTQEDVDFVYKGIKNELFGG